MKRVLTSLCLLLTFVSSQAVSAPTLKRADIQQLKPWDFEPALIPDSSEDVVTSSSGVYVDLITITNPTDSPVTVLITDKQGTPRAIVDASIAAKTTYVIKLWGYWAPGGVAWSAGTDAVLIGYMRILR